MVTCKECCDPTCTGYKSEMMDIKSPQEAQAVCLSYMDDKLRLF